MLASDIFAYSTAAMELHSHLSKWQRTITGSFQRGDGLPQAAFKAATDYHNQLSKWHQTSTSSLQSCNRIRQSAFEGPRLQTETKTKSAPEQTILTPDKIIFAANDIDHLTCTQDAATDACGVRAHHVWELPSLMTCIVLSIVSMRIAVSILVRGVSTTVCKQGYESFSPWSQALSLQSSACEWLCPCS